MLQLLSAPTRTEKLAPHVQSGDEHLLPLPFARMSLTASCCALLLITSPPFLQVDVLQSPIMFSTTKVVSLLPRYRNNKVCPTRLLVIFVWLMPASFNVEVHKHVSHLFCWGVVGTFKRSKRVQGSGLLPLHKINPIDHAHALMREDM